MSKKVLVLYYTQSGQLNDIIDQFLIPFNQNTEVSVEKVEIKPINDFPFPWTSDKFFDAMPESVLAITTPLQEFTFKEAKYDLVVFAYQPWFLSLSIPANSIILHPKVQNILMGANVITVIGARNMWLNSQEKLKLILKQAGANLVGNFALVDRQQNQISALTIMHWAFTGKKTSYLGVLPKPGVSDEDIQHAKVFGNIALRYLLSGGWNGLQPELVENGGAEIDSNLMFIEERAGRLFLMWANLVTRGKNRKAWITAYKYYLLVALFIVAPIVLTINFILFRVFFLGVNKRKKTYYASVQYKN